MGKLYVVPTPIGNLGDMTNRAIETLSSSDIILAEDTRHTQKLLNYFNIKTRLVSYHKFNEKKRSEEIIEEIITKNLNVSLVTDAGTPCISDPGYELVNLARENGVKVIGLAGASALTIALSTAGIDTSTFVFYGFLPRRKTELEQSLKEISKNTIKTFVIYESPKRIINLVESIQETMPMAILCVCKELTKLHENYFYGDVDTVLNKLNEHNEVDKGEYVVVGYNNEVEKQTDVKNQASIHAMIFDKLIHKNLTLKDAVDELSKEMGINKNETYKASLEVKEFIKSFGI